MILGFWNEKVRWNSLSPRLALLEVAVGGSTMISAAHIEILYFYKDGTGRF